jgi:serine/threonine protein kinase
MRIIMISAQNGFSRRTGVFDAVKVLDFGLVKNIEAGTDVALTASKAFLGTPLYASPEAMRNPEELTAASDLYAVAAVGYYLLTGTHVFNAQSLIEICAGHMYGTPERPSMRVGLPVPKELEDLILQGLSKQPDQRPPSACAFGKALRSCPGVTQWSEDDARAWWRSTGQQLLDARTRDTEQASAPMGSAVAVDLSAR